MEAVLEEFRRLKKESEEIKKDIEEIKKEKDFLLRSVEILRFNPFAERGGDQSFSVAFLNKKGDGAIITSLYTKEGSRIYGKPVKEGKSTYSLSTEEKEVIKRVLQ